jgi:2-keto-4-pentenoate hydratase/2-oxohepta-3-ene-1,7-dioic acid hydratase in catechol pathway
MGFRFANVAGRSALVDADGGWYDAERVSGGTVSSEPMAALESPDALHAAAALLGDATADGSLGDADVLAPVPEPRNVFGVGLNYATHAAESGMELPENPVVFTKFPSCIVGPSADVELRSATGDYEVELVVVIGGETRDVSADRAWEHVLGLTVGQDISDRALQFAAQPAHFDLGKSRDTYGPIGPVVVSTDQFDDPTDIPLRSEVNGEQRQSDRTSNLIFSVAYLVSYLSSIMTLRTGDLIFTGTPEGVGVSSRSFLTPGDVITSTIDGIGTMTNRCVE